MSAGPYRKYINRVRRHDIENRAIPLSNSDPETTLKTSGIKFKDNKLVFDKHGRDRADFGTLGVGPGYYNPDVWYPTQQSLHDTMYIPKSTRAGGAYIDKWTATYDKNGCGNSSDVNWDVQEEWKTYEDGNIGMNNPPCPDLKHYEALTTLSCERVVIYNHITHDGCKYDIDYLNNPDKILKPNPKNVNQGLVYPYYWPHHVSRGHSESAYTLFRQKKDPSITPSYYREPWQYQTNLPDYLCASHPQNYFGSNGFYLHFRLWDECNSAPDIIGTIDPRYLFLQIVNMNGWWTPFNNNIDNFISKYPAGCPHTLMLICKVWKYNIRMITPNPENEEPCTLRHPIRTYVERNQLSVVQSWVALQRGFICDGLIPPMEELP